MIQSFDHYKSKILSGNSPEEVIRDMRQDFSIKTDYSVILTYQGPDIPFNIEREYLNDLIQSQQYDKAEKHIENMKRTYTNVYSLNFIEVYEYHLNSVKHSEKIIALSIENAKKEFNKHTVTIVSVIVGVITILGTANQAFNVSNFEQGVVTFWSITGAVILTIIISFSLSK